jgi:hypothetical protein
MQSGIKFCLLRAYNSYQQVYQQLFPHACGFPKPMSRIVIRLVPSVSVAPAAIAGVAIAIKAPNVVIVRFMVCSLLR